MSKVVNLAKLNGKRIAFFEAEEHFREERNKILMIVKSVIEENIPALNQELSEVKFWSQFTGVPYKLRPEIFLSDGVGTFIVYPDFVGDSTNNYLRVVQLCDIVNDLPTCKKLASEFPFVLTINGGIAQRVVNGGGEDAHQ